MTTTMLDRWDAAGRPGSIARGPQLPHPATDARWPALTKGKQDEVRSACDAHSLIEGVKRPAQLTSGRTPELPRGARSAVRASRLKTKVKALRKKTRELKAT